MLKFKVSDQNFGAYAKITFRLNASIGGILQKIIHNDKSTFNLNVLYGILPQGPIQHVQKINF